jgi:hypothetical protein
MAWFGKSISNITAYKKISYRDSESKKGYKRFVKSVKISDVIDAIKSSNGGKCSISDLEKHVLLMYVNADENLNVNPYDGRGDNDGRVFVGGYMKLIKNG